MIEATATVKYAVKQSEAPRILAQLLQTTLQSTPIYSAVIVEVTEICFLEIRAGHDHYGLEQYFFSGSGQCVAGAQ